MVSVQEAAGATVPPFEQVPPVLAKSAAFVPEMTKNGVASVSVAPPVLETVTVSGELVVPWVTEPKATGLGAMLTVALIPVPERFMDALVLAPTSMVPDFAPAAVGVNRMMMVQFEPTGKD